MEILQGHCIRNTEGEPGTETFYQKLSDKPCDLAKLWRVENAKSIHIVDRDSMNGTHDDESRAAIKEIIRAVDIPIELYAKFATVDECRDWLDNGVFRIILTTLIIDDPGSVTHLVQEYTPSRVVVGVRAVNGIVSWDDRSDSYADLDFALKAKTLGINRIVYSDKTWEGTYFGPDVDVLKRIAIDSGMRVTALGGIDSPQELWQLHDLVKYGIDSVVIGRALFENRFPCQKIWRMAEHLESGGA